MASCKYILKEIFDLLLPCLSSTYNSCFLECYLPSELKSGDISHSLKKIMLSTRNCKPITGLSSVSKIFKQLMHESVISIAECFLSPLLCGFRKDHNTRNALLKFLETCKATIDNGGITDTLLMDLSKAFDILNHELLLAKLQTYGFGRSTLKLFHSYLSNSRRKVRINGAYSTRRETNLGVPQGSVLGSLIFNIFIADIFYLMSGSNICNYADDTILYSCDREVKNVITKLELSANYLAKQFPEKLYAIK